MHQTFRREGKPTDILDRMRSQSRGRRATASTDDERAPTANVCAMHPRAGDPACGGPSDLLRMTCGQLVCRGSALAHRIILPNCASCHATLQQSMQRDVIDPWKARYAVQSPPLLLDTLAPQRQQAPLLSMPVSQPPLIAAPPSQPPLLALPPPQPANHFLYSSPSPPPPPQMSWMAPQTGAIYAPPPHPTWTPAPYHAKVDAIMARQQQQQQQQQAAAPYPHSLPLPPRPAPLPPASDATAKALANLMDMLQQ